MSICIQLRPKHLILLSLIFHQVIMVSRFFLSQKRQDFLIIFPVAMRYKYVITKVIHLGSINIYRDQASMLSSLLEPTMKHHKSFSIRTNHQMIDLMFSTHHGIIWLKCSHIGIFEKIRNFSAWNIHFPDTRLIRA